MKAPRALEWREAAAVRTAPRQGRGVSNCRRTGVTPEPMFCPCLCNYPGAQSHRAGKGQTACFSDTSRRASVPAPTPYMCCTISPGPVQACAASGLWAGGSAGRPLSRALSSVLRQRVSRPTRPRTSSLRSALEFPEVP